MTEDLIQNVAGGAIGLPVVIYILKDWLKNRSRGNSTMVHDDHGKRIKIVEDDVGDIKTGYASLKSEFVMHAKQVNKKLDEGREDFKAIREDISKISENMATITAIVKERSSAEGISLLQR